MDSRYKYYKDLTINEKINAKSWGFWRMWNEQGFLLTMIDNADSFDREDYANFTKHHIVERNQFSQPKFN